MEVFLSDGAIDVLQVVSGSIIAISVPMFLECKKRKNRARYLAVRIANQLDKYLFDCVKVVEDKGCRDQEGILRAEQKRPPPPIYPDDVDWSSIDHGLMGRILSLPSKAEQADLAISDMFRYVAGPPDYEEGVAEIKSQYAHLGFEAHKITEKLRSKYTVPSRVVSKWGNEPLEVILQKQIDET